MKFIQQRLFYTKGNPQGDYSASFIHNEDYSFKSWILEDTHHDTKIAGATRIPAGFYELKLKKEDTPLTIKHRAAYQTKWFKANPGWFHVEVTGIANYSGVYLHSGNDDAHTLGCLLPAYSLDMSLANNQTSKSLLAVDDFYSIVHPLLWKGTKCFIEIRNEITI